MHPYFLDGRRLLFAHRGGAKRFPENTLFAFREAVRLGFTHIETDIQLSADGELMVFHDLTLERTTNGKGPVAAKSSAQLRELDAAYHFRGDGTTPAHRGQGHRIPTLLEVLEAFPNTYFNIEMKGEDLRLAGALHAFIERHGVHERVLAASANDRLTDRFRALDGARRVPTSPGARDVPRFWAATRIGVAHRMRWPFDVLQVPRRQGPLTVVDQRFVRAAHRAGIFVHVWTIDDALEMRHLAELGVDGVMSDRPEVLMQTLSGTH